MLLAAQGLGRLDLTLAARDRSFLGLSEAERLQFQRSAPAELMDRITLSYLWVLGAYEIVRALDQKSRTEATVVTPAQAAEVKIAKYQIERLRMPLAKFEPANRFADTDNAFALPVLHQGHGVAWLVSPNALISREDVAKSFLGLLQVLSA